MSREKQLASRNRLVLSVALPIAALLGAAAGAGLTLLIDRPHRWGAGLWISDWAKSSGAAGAGALVAASLAFVGLMLQMRLSKRALDHSKETAEKAQAHAQATLDHERLQAADRAWWDSFKWATTRALPASKDDLALPYISVVRTFEALVDSASQDVQRAAIAGVMNEASARHQSADDDVASDENRAPSDNLSDTSGYTADLVSALSTFVAKSSGTPASSRLVEAQLYELQVQDALELIQGDDVRRINPSAPGVRHLRADALMMVRGRLVVIEIRAFTPRKGLTRSAIQAVERIRHLGSSDPVLLITPVEIELPDTVVRELGVVVVQWTPINTLTRLVRALEDAAERDV